MSHSRRRKGFTLFELLAVVFILGVVSTVAIPYYIISMRDTRHKSANQNARTIGTAIQGIYSRINGRAYNDAEMSDANIALELGGSIPTNPCTGGNSLQIDYGVVLTETGAVISPFEGEACFDEDLPTYILGEA